ASEICAAVEPAQVGVEVRGADFDLRANGGDAGAETAGVVLDEDAVGDGDVGRARGGGVVFDVEAAAGDAALESALDAGGLEVGRVRQIHLLDLLVGGRRPVGAAARDDEAVEPDADGIDGGDDVVDV